MAPGELIPLPESLPELDPPLEPLPDPILEPDDDPVPDVVPPGFDELPGGVEPLDSPLPPEPVWEGDVVGVDGLFAAVVEDPVLPQPVNSTTEPRTAAPRRRNAI